MTIRQALFPALLIAALLALGAGRGAVAGVQAPPATPFFSSIQDLPVMPGLVELPDQGVVFDKPEGRIIEVVAALQAQPREDVRSYYDSVLPQLGWSRLDEGRYAREGEHLQVGFESNEGQQFLRIMVAPREGAQP